jgi:hypothetical protein
MPGTATTSRTETERSSRKQRIKNILIGLLLVESILSCGFGILLGHVSARLTGLTMLVALLTLLALSITLTGAVGVVQSLGDKELGVSHGMLCSQQGNLIIKYRSFEISVLPLERASVWTTSFDIAGKETQMAFTPEKRTFLVSALGEDRVKALEANTDATVGALKQLGVEYKSAEAVEALQLRKPVRVQDPSWADRRADQYGQGAGGCTGSSGGCRQGAPEAYRGAARRRFPSEGCLLK